MLSSFPSLVNDAYAVETGSEGVAFKLTQRLLSKTNGLEDAYMEGRILKAVKGDEICGVIVFELHKDFVYYGPFAVKSGLKGSGIVKRLIAAVQDIGKAHECHSFEILVVNHRIDILPMYEKWGYIIVGEEDYPDPTRLSRHAFFYRLKKAFD